MCAGTTPSWRGWYNRNERASMMHFTVSAPDLPALARQVVERCGLAAAPTRLSVDSKLVRAHANDWFAAAAKQAKVKIVASWGAAEQQRLIYRPDGVVE